MTDSLPPRVQQVADILAEARARRLKRASVMLNTKTEASETDNVTSDNSKADAAPKSRSSMARSSDADFLRELEGAN